MRNRRKMKEIKYFTKKKVIIFIIIIAIITSFIIPFVRFIFDDPILIGEKPYNDIKMGKLILEKGMIFEDDSILGGRTYIAKPYHLVLAGLFYFFEDTFSSVILSIFLSWAVLILFYLILQQYKLRIDQIFFILLVFVLSPIFIFMSGTPNEVSFSLFLLFLGVYLFQKQKDSIIWPLTIFLLSVFFNIINVLVILFLLIFISENTKDKRKDANLIITFVFFLAMIYYAPFFIKNVKSFVNIFSQNNIINFISDIGGQLGISIFAMILGFIGIMITWRYKQKLKNIYVLMIILFFSGFYFNYANIYLNVFFSIFAGLALYYLINMDWEIKNLRNMMILLLIYGLLFSSISYAKRVSESEPNKNIQESLEWLKNNSKEGEIVFSHYSKGLWIEYWSERTAVTDSLFNYDNAYRRLSKSEELFYSRDLDEIKRLLNNYNITYIYIDNSMKEGQVWDKKEGLWYSFRNDEMFNNVYENEGIEIWEVYFR
jgi:hypothetical protein